MKYSIVYSSRTGNTAMLAGKIRECLPAGTEIWFGAPSPEAAGAELIFAGFWTDKGSCDEDMAAFLAALHNKKIFLFGTAGFGGDPDYFRQILSRVEAHIDDSNSIAGAFMCQGKMPDSVRKRYESMPSGDAGVRAMLENFDRALLHPDSDDLERLKKAVKEIL